MPPAAKKSKLRFVDDPFTVAMALTFTPSQTARIHRSTSQTSRETMCSFMNDYAFFKITVAHRQLAGIPDIPTDDPVSLEEMPQ